MIAKLYHHGDMFLRYYGEEHEMEMKDSFVSKIVNDERMRVNWITDPDTFNISCAGAITSSLVCAFKEIKLPL